MARQNKKLARLLLVLCVALTLPALSAASFAAKAAGKKKGKAKRPAVAKGFGAPKAGAQALGSFGDKALDAAIRERCDALKKQKKNAGMWMQLGSLLVKANEYAEAQKVFRAGASLVPGDEMLSAAALTLGGDSANYCRDGAGPPSDASLDLAAATDDANFEGFEAPEEDILTPDQADRNVEWKGCKESLVTRGAVFKSTKPLLDPEDCAWVIEQVEAQAAISGWTKDRHVQAPTTDIPVSSVPAIRDWFDNELRSKLFPMVHSRFPDTFRDPSELRVLDAFVVRYDAREQASLPTHQDENTFSFTIALNDRSEYEGGGTAFERLRPVESPEGTPFERTVLNADAGGVVAFPGKLRHGGNVVTKGRRYIIPLFLYADHNRIDGREPGYVLRHLGVEEPAGADALSRYAQKVVDERSGAGGDEDDAAE